MNTLLLTYALLCGGDATLSTYGRHMSAGEVWLPSQSWAATTTLAGATVAGSITLAHLHSTHPKLATRLAWAAIATRTLVIANNLYVLHAQKERR